jgi:hypothetical protein
MGLLGVSVDERLSYVVESFRDSFLVGLILVRSNARSTSRSHSTSTEPIVANVAFVPIVRAVLTRTPPSSRLSVSPEFYSDSSEVAVPGGRRQTS